MAVSNLEVDFSNGTSGFMTWDDDADPLSYEINISAGASLDATKWVNVGKPAQRYGFRNLIRATQYTFGVRPRMTGGLGSSISLTAYTPLASLHNALCFKECVNYEREGERVSEHGNASNIVRAVADNDFKTHSTLTDYAIDMAVGGNPTRVDAVFVIGKNITRHSGTPTGGSGTGWTNIDIPATVKNWEGTDVLTTVAGFQHHLYLLPQHFTATSVRVQFQGSGVQIYAIALLNFGIEMNANGDFIRILPRYVDRDGVVHEGGGRVIYDEPLGKKRDKWVVDYVLRVQSGKTLIEVPEDFLYWRSENRNHFFFQEPSRFPARGYPAVFVNSSVDVQLRTPKKNAGELIPFQIAEQ